MKGTIIFLIKFIRYFKWDVLIKGDIAMNFTFRVYHLIWILILTTEPCIFISMKLKFNKDNLIRNGSILIFSNVNIICFPFNDAEYQRIDITNVRKYLKVLHIELIVSSQHLFSKGAFYGIQYVCKTMSTFRHCVTAIGMLDKRHFQKVYFTLEIHKNI